MEKLKRLSAGVAFLVVMASALNAASISYSFWAYDQYAGSAPYYSHFQVGTSTEMDPFTTNPSVAIIDLNHGNPYVYTSIENSTPTASANRGIGWHRYQFEFDEPSTTATILLDGIAIQSMAYSQTPAFFRFVLHDHIGGPQESVIDDFEFRVNGSLVYQQGFESPTLDSSWIVSRQDPGTYLSSGDTSFSHSGIAGLALGSTNNNNVAAIITFVPEPSSLALVGLSGLALAFKRKRQKIAHYLNPQ